MENDSFDISFYYLPDQLKGTAEVQSTLEDGQTVYLVRNIQFANTQEELIDSQLVIEEELRIKPVLQKETDKLDWVDADAEEESELATLIGQAIEKKIDKDSLQKGKSVRKI